jgi:hypothetical protein
MPYLVIGRDFSCEVPSKLKNNLVVIKYFTSLPLAGDRTYAVIFTCSSAGKELVMLGHKFCKEINHVCSVACLANHCLIF